MMRKLFRNWYAVTALTRGFVVAMLTVGVAFAAGCKHADQRPAVDATCDQARIQKLEDQGYTWLAQNQWYQAHLAAHALIAIGISCNDSRIAAPASIHGDYLMAAVSHAVHDERQSAYWIQRGQGVLALVKQHEAESPSLMAVYDQMQPRFLTLQQELSAH